MLYLSRKIGESIIINNSIELQVVEVRGKSVKLGFTFPSDASILRKELHDSIMQQNLSASRNEDGDDMTNIFDDMFAALPQSDEDDKS